MTCPRGPFQTGGCSESLRSFTRHRENNKEQRDGDGSHSRLRKVRQVPVGGPDQSKRINGRLLTEVYPDPSLPPWWKERGPSRTCGHVFLDPGVQDGMGKTRNQSRQNRRPSTPSRSPPRVAPWTSLTTLNPIFHPTENTPSPFFLRRRFRLYLERLYPSPFDPSPVLPPPCPTSFRHNHFTPPFLDHLCPDKFSLFVPGHRPLSSSDRSSPHLSTLVDWSSSTRLGSSRSRKVGTHTRWGGEGVGVEDA